MHENDEINNITKNVTDNALEPQQVTKLLDVLEEKHEMNYNDVLLETIISDLQSENSGARSKAKSALVRRVNTKISNILSRLKSEDINKQQDAIKDLKSRVSDHLANRVNERASMMGCRFLTPSEIRQINGALSKLKRRDLNSLKREVLVDVEKIDHEQKKLLAKVEKLKLGKPKAKTESFLDKAMKWRNMTQRFKSHWARRSNNENGPNKTKQ